MNENILSSNVGDVVKNGEKHCDLSMRKVRLSGNIRPTVLLFQHAHVASPRI